MLNSVVRLNLEQVEGMGNVIDSHDAVWKFNTHFNKAMTDEDYDNLWKVIGKKYGLAYESLFYLHRMCTSLKGCLWVQVYIPNIQS